MKDVLAEGQATKAWERAKEAQEFAEAYIRPVDVGDETHDLFVREPLDVGKNLVLIVFDEPTEPNCQTVDDLVLGGDAELPMRKNKREVVGC